MIWTMVTATRMQPELAKLKREIVACRLCPRLVAHRERVARVKTRRFAGETYWGRPVPALGDMGARLVVVGLAPAAHGGNRTGRMFTGDRSGDWLYEALHRFGFANQATSVDRNDGLELRDTLVTAAARCAPPENKPTREELLRCRPYLLAELRLLTRMRVVIVLGRIAFDVFFHAWEELGHTIGRPRPRFEHGGEAHLAGGVLLLASYHPSQRNTFTGKLTRSMFHHVFRKARHALDVSQPSAISRGKERAR
ncbi:MAG: uracil-DNA glycosylase [Vicinamibacteria bacterium]